MRKILSLMLIAFAAPAMAEDKAFRLAVPPALAEGGLTDYLLPRFSLKTGIRITQDPDAEAALGTEGQPVMRRGETLWHFSPGSDPDAAVFGAWLTSDVGQRTVEAHSPNDGTAFSAVVGEMTETPRAAPDGDADLGAELSLEKCGRCHVVNDENRMKAIGSSPSFALMRSFPDWQRRFERFYELKPHAPFTQVPGVTAPFADDLPQVVSPIEVTRDEIAAITAYAADIQPADLGAPLAAGVLQSP